MSWKPWLGSLVKSYHRFGWIFGFPRGDISHPLHPGIGLSTAKVQQFSELCKFLGIFYVENNVYHKLQDKDKIKREWKYWYNVGETLAKYAE